MHFLPFMLRSVKDLEGYTIAATDGDVGTVKNFLFDDLHWTVRYLVAQTGAFFGDRRVLISPLSFRQADWETSSFHVQLTMDKVKHSPDVDSDKSVSRQHEMELSRHYRYPFYWDMPGVWGLGRDPGSLAAADWAEPPRATDKTTHDCHLRSVNDVRGYHVRGTDAEIGHVSDFLVDDQSWEVRYLVVDTKNWWFGKCVLVAPQWVHDISWDERKIHIHKTRDEIRNSPVWDPSAAVNREYESRLYDYYGRPAYWAVG